MLLKLAQEYARLRNSAVLGHRLSENEKEIVFTLVSGEKYTLTEAELRTGISNIQRENTRTIQEHEAAIAAINGVGTVGDGEQTPAASPESADKPRKNKKEGN